MNHEINLTFLNCIHIYKALCGIHRSNRPIRERERERERERGGGEGELLDCIFRAFSLIKDSQNANSSAIGVKERSKRIQGIHAKIYFVN